MANNNNGGNYPATKSTPGFELINTDAGSLCQVSYFGSTMSISVGSFPAGSELTWERKRDIQKVQINLNFGDCCELEDICNDVNDEIKAENTFTSRAVIVGAKRQHLIELTDGEQLGLPTGIYLAVYSNLDDNRKPTTSAVYTFANTKVLVGYDRHTGGATETIQKRGEFKKFRKAVKKAGDALTMAEAHAGERARQTETANTSSILESLAVAMGVNVPKYNSGGYNQGGGYTSSGGYSNGGSRGNYSQPNTRNNNYNGGIDINNVANAGYPEHVTTGVIDGLD